MRERTEEQVAALMEAAQGIPEPAPERREQAMAAMSAAGRRASRGAPRRWIAVATMVTVGLIGLGFVPLPRRAAKGALDRALAAGALARTVHIVALTHAPDGTSGTELSSETWLAENGLEWWETRRDGRVTYQSLVNGPWETTYRPGQDGGPGTARATYDPCLLHPALMPDRAQLLRQNVAVARYVADLFGEPAPQITVREYREGSLWGGQVVVVEIETAITEQQSCNDGIVCGPGDTKLLRAELDPDTDLLLSERQYKVSGDQQQLVKETTYQWDETVPEEVTRLNLPPGTEVAQDDRWEPKAQQVLAQGETATWKVTLHAIDVMENGDLRLWLSREENPAAWDTVLNSAPPLAVDAVGDGGEQYTQDNSFSCMNSRYVGYWTTTLHPQDPSRRPSQLTLTIWPYDQAPCADESLTFRGVAVPAS